MLARYLKCSRLSPLNHVVRRNWASSSKPNDGPPNQAIIDMLEWSRAEEETKPNPDRYRVMSFARALNVIRAVDYPIRSLKDLEALKGLGIGPGMKGRIMALLEGQSYNPAKKIIEPKPVGPPVEKDKRVLAMRSLMTVSGIGKVAAAKLVDAGCRGLEDLNQPYLFEMLGPAQKIGFRYLTQISKPVQRVEAEALAEFIQSCVGSKWEVILVGSYRRGTRTSSDIDIMLLHPSHVHIPTPELKRSSRNGTPGLKKRSAVRDSPLRIEVLQRLVRTGIIAETLSEGPQKWQGVARIPERDGQGNWEAQSDRVVAIASLTGEFRRADLNMVPMKSRGAAMLSLTGDLDFNIDIRKRAQQMGMHLNEYGLWRFHPRNGDANGTVQSEETPELPTGEGHWELVASETEEEILSELGMPWVEPEKQNFSFVLDGTKKRSRGKPIAT